MSARFPFSFASGTTVSLSVTQASSNVALTLQHPGTDTVRLANLGPSKCYVRFAPTVGTATATTSDLCLPVGVETFFVKGTYIAAICDTGETCTLKATPGNGI